MRNDTRASQLQQIVQQLCTLPGGQNLDIIARKWPHFGPAEPGSAYQVLRRGYATQQMPESINVPDDSEEIEIRLRGALEAPEHRDALVDDLHAFFAARDIREHWEVRTHFSGVRDVENAYELTIYSHLRPPTQTTADFA